MSDEGHDADTLYRVAFSQNDMAAARALALSEGLDEVDLHFPTIIAVAGDEVVGVMSTTGRDDMVLAGPIVIRSDRRRLWTLIRLVDMYDACMRHVGVTSYVFGTDNDKLADLVEKAYNTKPYAVEGGTKWYIKRL
jgi:hypothetical protein